VPFVCIGHSIGALSARTRDANCLGYIDAVSSTSSVTFFVSMDGDLVSVRHIEWLGSRSWMMPGLSSVSAVQISFDRMS
jgi:hypothetical protein